MKKLLSIFMALNMVILTVCSLPAFANANTVNDSISYTYNKTTKTLVVTGKGEISDLYNITENDVQPEYYDDFYNAEELVVEEGITKISDSFSSLHYVKKISFPKSLTSLSESRDVGNISKCYALCNLEYLTSVSFKSGITYIGDYVFGNCPKLTKLVIPNTVTTLHIYNYANSTKITVPSSVKNLCVNTMKYGKNISFSGAVSNITIEAEEEASDFTPPTNSSRITYVGCDFKKITLPVFTKTVKVGFYVCFDLETITIPENSKVEFTSQYGYAIDSCTNLYNIYCYSKNVEVDGVFGLFGCYDPELIFGDGNYDEGMHYPVVYCYKNSKMYNRCKEEGLKYHTIANPSAIKNLSNKTSTTKTVTLSWNKSYNATKYVVDRYNSAQKKWIRVGETKNFQIDAEGKNGCKHCFRVRAYNDIGNGKRLYNSYAKIEVGVRPIATKVLALSSKKNSVSAKWEKQATRTSGYEIEYSTNSNFKNSKKILVSNVKSTYKTINNLKSKTTYYVRVRTYKTMKLNGKNRNIFSYRTQYKSINTL